MRQKIVGFVVVGDTMVAEFETYRSPISELKKAKKQVLFTTEDGVDIYGEGCPCYLVKEDKGFSCNTYNYQKAYANESTWHLFWSKSAADEFILLNRPILSIKDLLDNGFVYEYLTQTMKNLRQLAKSKMDKK